VAIVYVVMLSVYVAIVYVTIVYVVMLSGYVAPHTLIIGYDSNIKL